MHKEKVDKKGKKDNCRAILHEVVQLTLRRLPSESHASAWHYYENNVLTMRTMLYLFTRNIFTLLAVVSGNEVYD